MTSDKQYVTVGPASKILNCSPEWCRQLAKKGDLEAVRTETGIHLFDKQQVERFAIERSKKGRR